MLEYFHIHVGQINQPSDMIRTWPQVLDCLRRGNLQFNHLLVFSFKTLSSNSSLEFLARKKKGKKKKKEQLLRIFHGSKMLQSSNACSYRRRKCHALGCNHQAGPCMAHTRQLLLPINNSLLPLLICSKFKNSCLQGYIACTHQPLARHQHVARIRNKSFQNYLFQISSFKRDGLSCAM